MKKFFLKTKRFLAALWAVAKFQLFLDRGSMALWYSTLFLNLLAWGLLAWLLQMGSSIFILHYNAYLGIDMLINFNLGDPWYVIFTGPLIGFSLWLINLIIAGILIFQANINLKKGAKKQKISPQNIHFLGYRMILVGNLLLQISILIYVASIVLVNRF